MFRKFAFAILAAFALVVGLVAPASAETTADFSASWKSGASADAMATGVAIAGADATGKILLQEERTTMSAKDIKRMKPPTKAQIKRYGTVVHSNEDAQKVMTKQVTAYDKLVHNASVNVAKLLTKLKYADSAKEKRVLKKKLRSAQSHLKAITKDEDWKYRPLIRLSDGCFRNTGRNDRMNLTSFVECVKGDKAEIDLGFDPKMRDMRVVGVILTDGTLKTPCENFAFFDIPEGTPSEDMFIVVEAFAKVKLTVGVSVHVLGDLVIHGVMKQDGTTCDEDSKTVPVDTMVSVPPVTVTATDTDQALAFGQEQVQADADARAEVQKSVAATLQTDVSLTMQLSCDSSKSPDISVSAGPCVKAGQNDGYLDTILNNPNSQVLPGSVQLSNGQSFNLGTVGANAHASHRFTGLAAGTYQVTGKLTLPNGQVLSDSQSVTLPECPVTPPVDTPPSMTCTGMQHVFVDDDRSAFDFDSSDPNGDPISYGEPLISGPIRVVTVERTGNRLTVWIVAQDIPAGTSQPASVRVIATAGGKPVSCTVNTTVENNHTGW